jgi:tripartite-type tricarboxylate transporter receptor subunit TctC
VNTIHTIGWALAGLVLATAPASAQNYPTKPVSLVVPYAPGGQADALARTIGRKLSERWGQPVLVEYKPGAASTVGTDFVAKAVPDGHTLLLAPAPFVTAQYAYPKLNYDSRTDFAPVTLLSQNPLVVAINPARLPLKTMGEFIARAKAEPGKLTYGTSGSGGLSHLAVELFRQQAGIDVLHVPYKGGAPAITDLVGGQIDFMFASPLEVMPYVKSGRLAVLGVSTTKRLGYWPEVPTLKESGYPDYEAHAWFGLVAPGATPRNVVAKINRDVVDILKSPEVLERFASLGVDAAPTTVEAFTRFLAQEHVRWSAAVKAAGVKVE